MTTRLLKLAITCGVNFVLSSGKHIVRRHITDGAVQSHRVVVIHVGRNQAQGIFPGERCTRSDALGL